MYRQLIILFLFYLGSAALSPVFGEMALDLDKCNLLTLIGEDAEEETGLKNLHKNLDPIDGNGHSTIAIIHHFSFTPLVGKLSVEYRRLLSHRLTQRPLYLLFHSFLLYDF